MPRVKEIFIDARTLADFANLVPGQVGYFRNNYPDFAPLKWWEQEIVDQDEAFRRAEPLIMKRLSDEMRHREITGQHALDEKQLGERLREIKKELASNLRVHQWQVTQRHLRLWWRQRFKDDINFLTIMLGSIYDPDPSMNFVNVVAAAIRQVYPAGLPEDVTVEFPAPGGTGRMTSRSNLREGYIPMQRAIVYLFEHPWRARFCAECNNRFVAAEPRNKFCGQQCSDESSRQRHLKSWHAHKHEWRPPRPKRRKAERR